MASFHAELHLAGTTYRVVRCHYACHQPTDNRGRVNAKVRHDLLHLALDVPTDDGLLAWAATPFKALSGEVVFYHATQRTAHETIAFTAGQCVGYHENFESGASRDGAYVCQLTVAAPSFELRSGGPAALATASNITSGSVAAALPAAKAVLAAAPVAPPAVLQEAAAGAAKFDPDDPSTHFVRPAKAVVISPAVTQLLSSTIALTSRAVKDTPPPGFKEAVMADLQELYETPTGRKLLESLQASGKRIELFYGKGNGAAFPDASVKYPHGYWPPAFYAEDGITPGAGTAMGISYNPFDPVSGKGTSAWLQRPPAIGLAHELIHAEQAAYGRMRRYDAANGKGLDPANPEKLESVQIFELEAVGVPPHDAYAVTENKLRAEWNPPQPHREYY